MIRKIYLLFFLICNIIANATNMHHHKMIHHHSKSYHKQYKNYMLGPVSIYSSSLTGKLMKNGYSYNPLLYSVAHAKLPIGTKLKLINISNKRYIKHKVLYVEVTDRMAKWPKYIFDLSDASANYLSFNKYKISVKAVIISNKTFFRESHSQKSSKYSSFNFNKISSTDTK